MRILFLEEDFKTGQFSFTPQQVPLKTRKKQDMAIKHSRKNNMYINQCLEIDLEMLFITHFHQICITLMISIL